MSEDQKERFQQSLGEAVKSSLRAGRCSADARARLLESLARQTRAPDGLQEAELERFESALHEAVSLSQDWACADEVALKVESAVGREAGRDLLSERSAQVAGAELADPAKARYLQAWRGSVRRSQELLVAPPECRQRIERALQLARSSDAPGETSRVVPLISRARWKRALTAATTVAAGFALVFGLFWGSADKALAESVRKDHTRCCSALTGNLPSHCQNVKDSSFGPIPDTPVASSWTLVASKICQDDDGQAMVHNVYLRSDKTMSVHLFPPENEGDRATTDPRAISDEEFPVLTWEVKGWTVTACSQDLDPAELERAVHTPR